MTHTPESAQAAGLIVVNDQDCCDCGKTDAPCVLVQRTMLEAVCLECWGDQIYEDGPSAVDVEAP